MSVPFIQNAVDARRGRYQAQEEVLYLWSGQHVRRLVPGLEDLFADIYWLRTVQYFGGQRAFAEGKRFDLLGPLVDITTTLDPRLPDRLPLWSRLHGRAAAQRGGRARGRRSSC